jgi:L-ascorbate metabolism protein UlaG (beta-lactamase superfamily)
MATVKALGARGVTFHVGLGVGAHLRSWGLAAAQVVEHDWWSTSPLPGGVTLVSTPARHFSGRRGIGNDGTLWTSWALVGPAHRVYFSGDTGLTSAFASIASRLGPFDVALLEIGQWHPSWGDIHLGPLGALDAFAQLRAQWLLPIHWSTFELGLHAWSEPPETLTLEAARRGVRVLTPRLGESVEPGNSVTHAWWRDSPPLAATCPPTRPDSSAKPERGP